MNKLFKLSIVAVLAIFAFTLISFGEAEAKKIKVGFHDIDLFPLPEFQGARTGLVDLHVVARGKLFKSEGLWTSQWHRDARPSQEELAEKFTVNATSFLPPEKAEEALNIIMDLEKIDNISLLMDSICKTK